MQPFFKQSRNISCHCSSVRVGTNAVVWGKWCAGRVYLEVMETLVIVIETDKRRVFLSWSRGTEYASVMYDGTQVKSQIPTKDSLFLLRNWQREFCRVNMSVFSFVDVWEMVLQANSSKLIPVNYLLGWSWRKVIYFLQYSWITWRPQQACISRVKIKDKG